MVKFEGVLQKRGDDSIGLWRERCQHPPQLASSSLVMWTGDSLAGFSSSTLAVWRGGTSNGTATSLRNRPRFAQCEATTTVPRSEIYRGILRAACPLYFFHGAPHGDPRRIPYATGRCAGGRHGRGVRSHFTLSPPNNAHFLFSHCSLQMHFRC